MAADGGRRGLALLAVVLVVLALFINVLSAAIRHLEAEAFCHGAERCLVAPAAGTTSLRAVGEAGQRIAAAKGVHRLTATVIVAIAVLLVWRARAAGCCNTRERRLLWAMFYVILVLAVVGPFSVIKTLPGLSAVNYLGGLLLVAVALALYLSLRGPGGGGRPLPLPLLVAANGVLWLQALLGVWISVTYVLSLCGGGACGEPMWTLLGLGAELNPLRQLPTSPGGELVATGAAPLVHHLHAKLAVVAVALAVVVGVESATRSGWWLAALAVTQVGVGAAMAPLGPQVPLVLLHHLVAALMMLSLFTLSCNYWYEQHTVPRHDRNCQQQPA